MATKQEGGTSKVLPPQTGGTDIVLAMLKVCVCGGGGGYKQVLR